MSEQAFGAFIIIVIVAFSIAGAATVLKFMEGGKECKINSDCSGDRYCGSDFKCHEHPTIQNTIVKNDWTTPAAILGLSIVLGALILRKRQPVKKPLY